MSLIVLKLKKYKTLFHFLVICLLLMMFKSQRLLFTWSLPVTLVAALGLVSCLGYILYDYQKYRKTSASNLFISIIIILLYYYELFIISELGLFSLFTTTVTVFVSIFLILTDDNTKSLILKYVLISTQVLVGISLLGWLLFLMGVPMPHYYSETDAYYSHTVYHLFVLNGLPDTQLIPRFAGFFLEPGHLGTMCCFLLHIGGYQLKKIGNVVLLLGVLLSLSLAAYGLLIGGFCLHAFFNKKNGLMHISLFVILVLVICGISYTYKSGDNLLYKKIVERLIFEDGEMAGANRTTDFFDTQFERYVTTSKVWFGVGREAFNTKAATNLINGCAGWKRYFFLRGYVGCMLLLVFWISYFYKFRSKAALSFFIMYVVANMIRDYPLKEYWLFIWILAIPTLTELYKRK